MVSLRNLPSFRGRRSPEGSGLAPPPRALRRVGPPSPFGCGRVREHAAASGEALIQATEYDSWPRCRSAAKS